MPNYEGLTAPMAPTLTAETFFGNSRGAAEPLWRKLVVSQTLESVLEIEEAVLGVCGVGGSRRVAKLGVGLVALWLADPGEADLGRMINDDVITGADVEGSQAIDEELWKTENNVNTWCRCQSVNQYNGQYCSTFQVLSSSKSQCFGQRWKWKHKSNVNSASATSSQFKATICERGGKLITKGLIINSVKYY